jgi:glycosyltransferase involved in cell wall biosynthesis
MALMPEPVESPLSMTQVDARRELGLPTDDRLLMVLGALDSRKGVVELMRAFRDAAPYRTRLVLMGLLYSDVRDAVMSLSDELGIDRCIVRDAMLSQRDFSLGFAASDWQALTYRQHIGSSGILVRAAAYGRPVLASDWGWIGQATQQFGLGSTCDTSSNESIVEGIHRLVASPTLASAQASRFANFNTERNFCAHWSRTLEGETGLPDPSYLPWN